MFIDKRGFSSTSFFRPLLFSLLVAFVFALLPGGGTQASAINECIDACFSGFACAFKQDDNSSYNLCQSERDRCVEQCNKNVSRGEEAPPVTGAYGAIAYDEKSGAWGMADASQSKGDAKKSALAYCKKHGSDCEIVESFSKTCAAVAAGTGNRLAWAVDDNPKQAGLDAIKKCGKSGKSGDNSRCFLQLYHCYSP
jgi:hypothetical protein